MLAILSPDEDAIQVLTSLVEGYDPCTGELLDDYCICFSPEVESALTHALRLLEKRVHRKRSSSARRGKLWQEEEDNLLRAHFAAGHDITQLAALHERSSFGIMARLVKLGLLPDIRKSS